MKKNTITAILIILMSTFFGQNNEDLAKNFLNIEAHVNIIRKTRSYGVLDPEDKFSSTSFRGGFDASIYYQINFHQVGVEIFPYLHTNAFYGFDVFSFLGKKKKIKLVPELKYGYSWILEKQYTGIGIKIQYKYFNLKLNRMLHIKSGTSQYWGDGLTGVSLGFTFNGNMLK